jgi:P-type conjugative transfer protein TrbJ
MAKEGGAMKGIHRRRLLAGAIGCGAIAALGTFAPPAQADLFGGDVAVLTAILTQSISQAISLTNMVMQITSELKMMTTMLHQVASGSFPALVAFVQNAQATYSTLTTGVQAMTYRMARIDAEYQKLFPSGSPPQGTAIAQHRAQYVAWNEEVVGAAQIAARQQTSLSTLDTEASQTEQVLQQSKSATGVVEALQLITQMIGITNSELTLLNQTLATTSRVLIDMAASSASERQLSLGMGDDVRSGYTDKGAAVTVPHSLP